MREAGGQNNPPLPNTIFKRWKTVQRTLAKKDMDSDTEMLRLVDWSGEYAMGNSFEMVRFPKISSN